ncbi:hypothetical protein Hbl1158_02605 [Halobaculum sp. CBA1158]|uniref:hypothetical protein n=1 Tax=Halobaculum sp. CBA1158 TaxID=2904243 RepID=UPI001F1A7849|nr:hypothetical protein [Halobaculum sp. CBA1158]UIP00278.1 hypothetical protein Hbl1158_02605 [Halobaculum sp. CBA1158]
MFDSTPDRRVHDRDAPRAALADLGRHHSPFRRAVEPPDGGLIPVRRLRSLTMSSDTKHIRVPSRVHERITALKRDDETIGETIERLIDGYDLVDFARETEPVADADEREELRAAYTEYAEELERTMVESDDT